MKEDITRAGRPFRAVPALLALWGLTALLPASAAPRRHDPTSGPGTVRIPRLNYKQTLLSNGLKVVTLEDHRAPVVTVEVWYRVGSKDEAPGKDGFAHLFEHLMFKGSAHVGPEQHARYVEQVGGLYNADTSFDRTRYFETVPSNALDQMLWLEADRMASLHVDEPNLKSERAVVEEELRLRVANAPYGRVFEKLFAMIYPAGAPYAHPTIGSIPDLDSAKLSDVQAFHDMYYKPDNATLIVSGDFKTAEALAKIRRYFGPIPRSTQSFTRYPNPTPSQTAAQQTTYDDPLAPLARVTIAYRMPSVESADTPVFEMMSTILSQGTSSRLYRTLVRDRQLALQASAGPFELKLGGTFLFNALAAAGKDPDEVAKALEEQIDLLRTQPVSAQELEKARNQEVHDQVFSTISSEERADALGQADLLYGTPEEVNRSIAKLTAVTAADIQRVAAKYLIPERRSVLITLPAAGQNAAKTGGSKP